MEKQYTDTKRLYKYSPYLYAISVYDSITEIHLIYSGLCGEVFLMKSMHPLLSDWDFTKCDI